MKKLLSLALVMCMLLGCAAFSSCGSCAAPLSTKDVENDAQGVLSTALGNTAAVFFSDYAGIAPVANESMKGGSFAVAFEGGEDLFGADAKISETIYFNEKDHQYVSDTFFSLGGEELSARIFVDKTGFALNSEAILGNSSTVAVNFATLADGLQNGALKDMLGLEASAVTNIVEVINIIKTEYEALFADNTTEESKKEANEILAMMNQVVAEETVKNEAGEDTACVVITYTLTNETYKAMIHKLMADFDLTDEEKAALDAELDELLAIMSINLTEKFYINKNTRQIEKLSTSGTVTVNNGEEPETMELSMDLAFGTAVKLTVSVSVAGQTIKADATLTKEETAESVIYKLVFNADNGTGVTVNFLNVDYTYTKSTGAFLLSASVYNGMPERGTFALSGNIAVTKESAKIEFTSISLDEETYNFKLSFAFNKNAEIPTRPADTKDIASMTEAEWETLLTDMMENGILGQMMGQPAPDPDM